MCLRYDHFLKNILKILNLIFLLKKITQTLSQERENSINTLPYFLTKGSLIAY